MKMDKELVIKGIAVIFLFSLIVGVATHFTLQYAYEREKLCADNFDGISYSYYGGYEGNLIMLRYQNIDETHYNCCYDEVVELSDEGYYTKRKCKGFVKDE